MRRLGAARGIKVKIRIEQHVPDEITNVVLLADVVND